MPRRPSAEARWFRLRTMVNSHATDIQSVGTTPDRPDDCRCYDGMLARGLPCWPCYRAGFELPNPHPSEGDD